MLPQALTFSTIAHVPLTDSACFRSDGRIDLIKAALTILFGLLIVLLLYRHTPWLAGPSFWSWSWKRIPAWPLYGLMLASALPLLAGHIFWREGRRWRTALALLLAMFSCFCMKLSVAAVQTRPLSLQVVYETVEDRNATSYYTDAAALNSQMSVREWLGQFPQLMSGLSLHSQTKAPGPILFYTLLIKWLGPGRQTALIGGLLVGALGTLSIPATYCLIRILARDRLAAICGATYLTLCPGFVLFFPMLDPVYILLTSGLIGTWVLALRGRSMRCAIALGAAIAFTCVVSFHVLILGLFMMAYPLVMLRGTISQRAQQALAPGLVALSSAAALLLVFRAISGYDPIATFAAAWTNQQALLAAHAHTRQYPQTIPFDLIDFALGSGWMSAVLLVWFFLNPTARVGSHVKLAALCLAQPLAVAISGQLQLETARVWNFMLPLLMVPLALELRTWTRKKRLALLVMLCVMTAAVAQNLGFLY